MSRSSLVHQVKATLLKVTVLSAALVLFLALFNGMMDLSVIAPWGVCGLAFGVAAFNIVWHLLIPMPAQYNMGDAKATRLFADLALSIPLFKAIEPKPLTLLACAFKDAPAYCTPLEMLNRMSFETDASDDHDSHITFATVVQGSEDNCTFATSPFTSPPMCTIEIFVRKEETIIYEDDVDFIPSSTPSPLLLDHDFPYVHAPGLAELIEYCEDAIMESNMRDAEPL